MYSLFLNSLFNCQSTLGRRASGEPVFLARHFFAVNLIHRPAINGNFTSFVISAGIGFSFD